jgi:chemotaxis signal transduction protein
VAGVFSARGRILAVVDLWAFLGLPTLQAEAHGQRKIIVVTNGPALPGTPPLELALLVDEVINVAPIFAQEIKPPLATHAFTEYIQGLTSDLLIVLNLSALLNEKRLILNEDI